MLGFLHQATDDYPAEPGGDRLVVAHLVRRRGGQPSGPGDGGQ